MHPRAALQRLWWGVLAYTLFVILFGAVVRITGSGAGCGQHWPTCQGEIAPLPSSVEMAIEFTHRLTSGLSMLLLFGCAAYTFVVLPRPHPARRVALLSCVFMIFEAALGARLVLLGLVGQNDTAPRAVIMALHLLNTSALVATMLACVRAVSGEGPRDLGLRFTRSQVAWWVGTLSLLILSATGAVTALGDTLYPVSASEGARVVAQAADSGSHFLERLRGFHPILALLGGGYLFAVAYRLEHGARMRPWLIALVLAQLGAGVINIGLSAPGWLQVLHLALANLLWMAWLWAWFDAAQPSARLADSGGFAKRAARQRGAF